MGRDRARGGRFGPPDCGVNDYIDDRVDYADSGSHGDRAGPIWLRCIPVANLHSTPTGCIRIMNRH